MGISCSGPRGLNKEEMENLLAKERKEMKNLLDVERAKSQKWMKISIFLAILNVLQGFFALLR